MLSSAFSGFYLYFKLGKAKQRLTGKPLRIWHRRLGLIVSLSALIFASSGLFHLIMSYQQQRNAIESVVEMISVNQLNEQAWQQVIAKPLAKLDLLSYGQKPYWYGLPLSAGGKNQQTVSQVAVLAKEKIDTEQHNHHSQEPANEAVQPYVLAADIESANINRIEDLVKLKAVNLAKTTDSSVEKIEWITKFENEYGFIFKRMPVIKVQMSDADQTRYYIEPATGALSAKVRNIDGIEGFVFAYLHKWSFNFINKDLRDILVSLFALGNLLVAVMGFIMFYKKYAK